MYWHLYVCCCFPFLVLLLPPSSAFPAFGPFSCLLSRDFFFLCAKSCFGNFHPPFRPGDTYWEVITATKDKYTCLNNSTCVRDLNMVNKSFGSGGNPSRHYNYVLHYNYVFLVHQSTIVNCAVSLRVRDAQLLKTYCLSVLVKGGLGVSDVSSLSGISGLPV